MFNLRTCTGELQPLDVGFNGLWMVFITKFANMWLSESIMQQLWLNPDPTKVKLELKKSDLVAPFLWVDCCRYLRDEDQVRSIHFKGY
jgi:hypothetical protein